LQRSTASSRRPARRNLGREGGRQRLEIQSTIDAHSVCREQQRRLSGQRAGI
jgi:hypothetical protein